MQELIMIIEDERKIAGALEYALKREGYKTVCVYRGDLVMEAIHKEQPAVILLDRMLPGRSGEEILRDIREILGIGVIYVTAKDDMVDKVVGLELGADDYITKPFDIREVLVRVKVLLRRLKANEPVSSQMSTHYGGIDIYTMQRRITVEGTSLELTPKEYDLFVKLCCNKEIVYTRESLLELIWGSDYTGGTRTVDLHIQRIRKKLPSPYDRVLQTVYGVGYYAIGGQQI